MAFVSQIRIVFVVKTCLAEQFFVFKGMPYERQLKVRQIYKTLSLGVEQIKSDVNLKFSLNVSCNAIHRRRFQRIEDRTVPCAYASPASNGLLKKFIYCTEKARNVKGAF